jgi:hemolysin activation/secretion protein
LTIEVVRAQTINPVPIPDPVLPTPAPSPLPTPPLLPPPEDLLKPSTPPPIPPSQLPNVPGVITVERFEIVGSTVFSSEELAEVTAQYTKKPITFAELLQAASAITQLYTGRGYVTSGAFSPADQTFRTQGGIVRIEVVEGSLEAIQVSGTRRLNPDYVRSRLAVATAKPLNVNRLLEALQLLQLNPLLRNISAELSAGSSAGQSLLEVTVTEAQSFSTQLRLDNNRSPSVGSFRRGLQINEANLFGQGDVVSIAYLNTDGSNALEVNYTYPLNPDNGTLSLGYRPAWNNVIERPFNALDIQGATRDYDLTFRQPLILTLGQEFALGLTATRRESDTALLGIPFPLSPGADDQGRTRLSVLRFFQDFTQRSSRQVIAARSQFSLGLGLFDATINETPPDGRFFAWRGQGQWVRLLAPDTLLLVRGDLQLADRALVPIEQFSLGGQETVRGYRQDLLLSDNGATASVEVRLPIFRLPDLSGVLQVAPFIDFGTAFNSSGEANPNPNTLASVGLGLQWQMGDRLTARFDYGIPLVSVDRTGDSLQENGFYFSLVYNPF